MNLYASIALLSLLSTSHAQTMAGGDGAQAPTGGDGAQTYCGTVSPDSQKKCCENLIDKIKIKKIHTTTKKPWSLWDVNLKNRGICRDQIIIWYFGTPDPDPINKK